MMSKLLRVSAHHPQLSALVRKALDLKSKHAMIAAPMNFDSNLAHYMTVNLLGQRLSDVLDVSALTVLFANSEFAQFARYSVGVIRQIFTRLWNSLDGSRAQLAIAMMVNFAHFFGEEPQM
jgi:hypothetical protein